MLEVVRIEEVLIKIILRTKASKFISTNKNKGENDRKHLQTSQIAPLSNFSYFTVSLSKWMILELKNNFLVDKIG